MNRIEAALVTLVGVLDRNGRRAALVGGLAVSTRTEPRFTRDIDLAVAVANDEEAEALVRGLLAEGFSTIALVEQETTRRLATVRVALPRETVVGVVGDLLFASSGIESLVVADAEPLEVFPGLFVPVARVGHLIALKLLSRDDRDRPQDLVDLNALFRVANNEEVTRARDAVQRIEQSGFSRGRDLLGALAKWLRDGPGGSQTPP